MKAAIALLVIAVAALVVATALYVRAERERDLLLDAAETNDARIYELRRDLAECQTWHTRGRR